MSRLATFGMLFLLLFLGGCSWIHEFYLVNNSGKELEVRYTLLSTGGEGIFDTVPLLVNGVKRDTLPYVYDSDKKAVFFRLPAGKKAVIGRAMNTSFEAYKDDPVQFNLQEIVSGGKTGKLTAAEIILQTVSSKVGEAQLELR